jgi:hypothetical protein
MAGEHDRTLHLIVEDQLGRWVRPVQLDPSLVGNPPKEGRQPLR